MLEAFGDHVRSFVDTSALKPLKVVADTANGMGGLVVPTVFEGLPFSLTVLYGELDGTFPNHPADPIQPENLKDLQRAVLDLERRHRSRVRRRRRPRVPRRRQGRARERLDHDRDRRGRHPRPSSRARRSCTTSSARARVPEIIREHGGTPVRTRVGHSFIKQVMAETGAIFGGEHSAHYYFRDNWRADSGSIAALFVLEQLGRAGRPAVGAAQAVRALRAERRDQLAGRRPAGGHRDGRGRVRRVRRRTGSTA